MTFELSPLAQYTADLTEGIIQKDADQLLAVEALQDVYDAFLNYQYECTMLVNKFMHITGVRKLNAPQGLYLWGGVGRGKTYVMDLFFEALPHQKKMRTHFHRFMQRVHIDLRKHQGKKNPLERVAQDIACETQVICFDEFLVNDITDAMLLAGLLDALFKRQVVFIATSNINPENLYKEGLQRERFLPAIALILKHLRVMNVDSGVDYRLRELEQSDVYEVNYTRDHALFESKFKRLTESAGSGADNEHEVEVLGRALKPLRCVGNLVWFEFSELCDGPRSQNDYIALAKRFHAIMVSHIPKLDDGRDDQAKRFIHLVDECYDQGIKLILSADTHLENLYEKGRLSFEFKRTVSRLTEMQSIEYLEKAPTHRFT